MFVPTLAELFGSPIQIFAVLLIALLIFGHKLPGLARSLGSSVSEFKKGVKEGSEEDAANAPTEPPEKTPTVEEKKK